jgi:hypothetical protein
MNDYFHIRDKKPNRWLLPLWIAAWIVIFTGLLLLFSGCAHIPVTLPDGPGGAVVGVTKTGLIFTDSGHDLWLREGVPAAWFTPVTKGKWYISKIDWHAGNLIRLKGRN